MRTIKQYKISLPLPKLRLAQLMVLPILCCHQVYRILKAKKSLYGGYKSVLLLCTGLIASFSIKTQTIQPKNLVSHQSGYKNYELQSHNKTILSTISDITIPSSTNGATLAVCQADKINHTDYSAFGVELTERSYSKGNYRYGFSGMEKEKEIKGEGNSYNFEARIYDNRLGRWLSIDKLASKFPDVSPYAFVKNSPIMYIDPDGNDVVYFDKSGNEIGRITSKIRFETYISVGQGTENAIHAELTSLAGVFIQVPMPNRIESQPAYDKNDYNKHDYNIAAQTYLFNEKKNNNQLPKKTSLAERPTGVPDIDPNTVKAMALTETRAGNYKGGSHNGDSDILQVNVSGDWSDKKREIGLNKGITPSPRLSLNAGLNWLYFKGTTISTIKDDKGKFKGYASCWTGGCDWSIAVKKYNGGGDSDYMTKFYEWNKALETGVLEQKTTK